MKNSVAFPQKIKNRITLRSSNPTSGYMSKRNENRVLKGYLYPHGHCSTLSNSQGVETTRVHKLMNGLKKKSCHIHTRVLFSHEKEKNPAHCYSTDKP